MSYNELASDDGMKTECISTAHHERDEYVHAKRNPLPDYDSEYIVRKVGICLNCFEKYDTETASVCPFCGYRQGTNQSVSYHLPTGTVLDRRYVLGVTENFGGFGIIYRAWDTRLKCLVAIKEYFNATLINRIPGTCKVELFAVNRAEQFQKETERFFEEAKVATRFEACRNFVHVYDFFRENGTAYMVMEFLTGSTLECYMNENGGRLPWDFSESIILELADAISMLHKDGIIHRDISPDNIFICDDDTVKLMDLGAARFPGESNNERKLVIVKPGLAPPEQYQENDSNQGAWTDVYALAATFYWAITGIKPEESTDRAVKDIVVKPSLLVDDVPAYLDNIILKGMNIHKELRFQNVNDFKKALVRKNPIHASDTELKGRRTFRNILIIVSLLILVCVGVSLFSEYRQKRSEALLEDSEITVWIPYLQDGSADDAIDIYTEMTAEFQQKYPHVQVDFVPVESKDYAKKVKESLAAGSGEPIIFNNTVAKADRNLMTDASDSYTDIDPDKYLLLDTDDVFTVPLGMNCSILFTNQVADEGVPEYAENLNDFIEGKGKQYIGDIKDYSVIQDNMSGRYTVKASGKPSDIPHYTDEWAVNANVTDDERDAALRLLSFWLSDTSQDILHVQNRGVLPVSKKELAEFLSINGELSEPVILELSGIFEDVTEYE